MLQHPIDTMEGEILPSGAIIFTPMELTVIALARSDSAQCVQSGNYSIARGTFVPVIAFALK